VVLEEMRNRQANGLSKSGRYKAEDTARLKYIHWTITLPFFPPSLFLAQRRR
jgi:hypothetical protein